MLSIDDINKLKEENAVLQAYKDVNEDFKTAWEGLKAENDKLKEEVETRDNLIDHFRDEALYRATIASEYQKDRTKLEQTLQEIKAIVCGNYEIIDPQGRKDILKLITRAEEE